MRVIRISEVQEEPMSPATPTADWTGGPVGRTRQTIIPQGGSKDFNCSVVNFGRGATSGWGVHNSDEIVVIIGGHGIVGNEQEHYEVGVGDVVHVMAGENHYHGATKDSYMSQIAITAVESESRR